MSVNLCRITRRPLQSRLSPSRSLKEAAVAAQLHLPANPPAAPEAAKVEVAAVAAVDLRVHQDHQAPAPRRLVTAAVAAAVPALGLLAPLHQAQRQTQANPATAAPLVPAVRPARAVVLLVEVTTRVNLPRVQHQPRQVSRAVTAVEAAHHIPVAAAPARVTLEMTPKPRRRRNLLRLPNLSPNRKRNTAWWKLVMKLNFPSAW